MKYVVIGLGYFGAILAEKLSIMGNEVIGVDKEMRKVEGIKDKVAHAICMDCSDSTAVNGLPLKDTDVVVVAIGEDQGAGIMVTALLRQLQVKRLISRAVSPLQETVLRAMGVTEIIHPEEETAERWSNKLNMDGTIDSLIMNKDFSVVEVMVPKKYVGRSIEDIDFLKHHNLIVLSSVPISKEKSAIGLLKNSTKIKSIVSPKTVLKEEEILLMYGDNEDIKDFIKLG
ncbi:MAG: TrkA family potassium uptake protein [Flavobacteriales bacterium]|jgi:trk system potassium uptake protein TrkA|nr:TrkA family potassium uptake protein [Flavobacteriales bacterium]